MLKTYDEHSVGLEVLGGADTGTQHKQQNLNSNDATQQQPRTAMEAAPKQEKRKTLTM
ncbi:MAG: hypothetical protein AAF228_09255 [Pseudomonadota bacterium]